MLLQNIEQIEELRKQLIDDKISTEDVWQKMKEFTGNFKSWRTPYWKKARQDFIDDVCAECGAKESDGAVMVVQHGWKPHFGASFAIHTITEQIINDEKYTDVREACYAQALEQYPENPPISKLCPNCGYKSIRFRKKTNDYACGRCKVIFEAPIEGVAPQDQERYADKDAVQKRIAYWYRHYIKQAADQIVRSDTEIQKQLHIIWIDENLRYLRFEGAKTCCKRCAFLEDKYDSELKTCPFCNKNQIQLHNSICRHCSYDEETGIFTLTYQNAIRWYKKEHSFAKHCLESVGEDAKIILFFECVLKQHNLTVIEVAEEYLRVKAMQSQIYEALSEGKSWY